MKVYVVKEVYDVTEKDENVRVFKTRTSAENFINEIINKNPSYNRDWYDIEELPFEDN